jgi:hypothetical protein
MEEITYIKGKPYTYDPDFDVYRPYVQVESVTAQWAWIVVVIVLAAVCYWISLPK